MSFMSLFDKLSVNKDGNATDDSKSNIDGDVWCMFCSDNVQANVIDVALFGELSGRSNVSHWIKVHNCVACGFYSALSFDYKWYPYDSILTTEDSSVEGIKPVESYAERLALFTLSQICYPYDDLGRDSRDLQSENLSSFLPPGPHEVAKILWSAGKAVGFYTVKEKGTQLSDCAFETYAMPMLDTMYVRKSMRRRGFAQRLLEDFICTNSGITIGISYPISNGMLKVLEKILQTDVGTRDRLWACSYTGEEGYRSNLWFLVRSKKC